MNQLLKKLRTDHPSLSFKPGESFYWSPKESTVYYVSSTEESDGWTLLHETSHGILGHQTFSTDFELLKLELAAWEQAKTLAAQYGVIIDGDHIEDCLDTYRTWLYKRSLCPSCGQESLQKNESTYGCLNCGQDWNVSANRLCRPYRASKYAKTAKTAASLATVSAKSLTT